MASKTHLREEQTSAGAEVRSRGKDRVEQTEASACQDIAKKREKHWLAKHWSTFGAAFVIIYLAINILPTYTRGLGSLNRYVVVDKVEWRSPRFGRESEIRTTVLRGAPESELIKELTAKFPESKGWSKPYIERGNCFAFVSYNGRQAFSLHSVIAVGHQGTTRNSEITITRIKPLTGFQSSYAALKEQLVYELRNLSR